MLFKRQNVAPSDESFMIGIYHGARDDLYVQASDEWRAGPLVGPPRPAWKKVKLPAECVLHIDHLFARMQRLNTYEAKTNTMTRIGSNLSQVLPPPFSCE